MKILSGLQDIIKQIKKRNKKLPFRSTHFTK